MYISVCIYRTLKSLVYGEERIDRQETSFARRNICLAGNGAAAADAGLHTQVCIYTAIMMIISNN